MFPSLSHLCLPREGVLGMSSFSPPQRKRCIRDLCLFSLWTSFLRVCTWPLCEQNTQASRLQARDMSYQDQPSRLLWGLGYSIKLLPVTEDVCVFLHKKKIVYFMSCSDEQRTFIFTIATFLLASILNVHCVEMIGFSML